MYTDRLSPPATHLIMFEMQMLISILSHATSSRQLNIMYLHISSCKQMWNIWLRNLRPLSSITILKIFKLCSPCNDPRVTAIHTRNPAICIYIQNKLRNAARRSLIVCVFSKPEISNRIFNLIIQVFIKHTHHRLVYTYMKEAILYLIWIKHKNLHSERIDRLPNEQ